MPHDWLLARYLFPTSRAIYRNAMGLSAMRGESLFDADEEGHPLTFIEWLREMYGKIPPRDPSPPSTRSADNLLLDYYFTNAETVR